MDFLQCWKDAIQILRQSTVDPKELAVIGLIECQVDFKIINNNICFICNTNPVYKLMGQYASKLYIEICKLLGNDNLEFELMTLNEFNSSSIAGDQNFNSNNSQFNDMQSSVAPMPAQNNYYQQPNVNYNQNNNIQQQNNQYQQSNNYQQPRSNYQQQNSSFNNNIVYDSNNRGQTDILGLTDNVNPDMTFENYVTDPENQLVYAIAQRIAMDPGSDNYNPFYIYGGSGLGKTHLLWAIANRIRETRPDISVKYIRAEEFIRKFVDAISRKNFAPQQVQFQDEFTKHDVFIMDDIQSLTKGDKARDAFFEIIADFLDKPGRQLILASDVAPGILKNFNQRLISRFGSGVCSEIYPPNVETRAAITLAKCKEMNISLPTSIVDYISNNIRSSVREIVGAIKTLKSQIDFKGTMISYEEAVKTLASSVNVYSQVTNIDAIKERVAKEYEVTTAQMESASRKAPITTARAMAMKLAKELTTLSLSDIGRSFNKDHSSVISAVKKAGEKIEGDPEQAAIYKKLTLSLKKD